MFRVKAAQVELPCTAIYQQMKRPFHYSLGKDGVVPGCSCKVDSNRRYLSYLMFTWKKLTFYTVELTEILIH